MLPLSSACADYPSRKDHHRSVCIEKADLEIYDRNAWLDFTERLLYERQRTEENRLNENAPNTLLVVPGYEYRFGTQHSKYRSIVASGLKQEDVYVFRDNKPIAKLVDFVDLVDMGSFKAPLSCVLQYVNLYLGMDEVK